MEHGAEGQTVGPAAAEVGDVDILHGGGGGGGTERITVAPDKLIGLNKPLLV